MFDSRRDRIARTLDFFGAHRVPRRAGQERERALQRGVVASCIAAAWLVEMALQDLPPGARRFLPIVAVYALVALGYRERLRSSPAAGVHLQYAFLVLDPLMLMAVLLFDPRTFAFLNPLVPIVIVFSGLRYGLRTMCLAWVCTLLASPLLAASPYWRSDPALTLSFLLMLVAVPLFFSSLVRRTHDGEAIEGEAAGAGATRELSLARSAFLARLSHELRSPLQSIVSALDVIELRHSGAFEGDGELVSRMRRSSLLLNTQLRDLMTLAKGEAGPLELRPEPFEALALVETLADEVREEAQAKGLELSVELPPEPVFAVADGARLEQVLFNLVTNSIRYTDSGQIRLTLDPYDPRARRLRFTVADTGPGIPAAALPTLFAPDKLITHDARRGAGSGIGLAIVRILVEHLGGRIAVESGATTGTTFTLEIPAEPAAASPPPPPPPRIRNPALFPATLPAAEPRRRSPSG